jgi:hypothetical protein
VTICERCHRDVPPFIRHTPGARYCVWVAVDPETGMTWREETAERKRLYEERERRFHERLNTRLSRPVRQSTVPRAPGVLFGTEPTLGRS